MSVSDVHSLNAHALGDILWAELLGYLVSASPSGFSFWDCIVFIMRLTFAIARDMVFGQSQRTPEGIIYASRKDRVTRTYTVAQQGDFIAAGQLEFGLESESRSHFG